MKLSQLIIEADEVDLSGVSPEVADRLRAYPQHVQQWCLLQLRAGGNLNSVVDAANYYISKIRDNRFREILKGMSPQPKNILTLSLDNIKSAQSVYDERFGARSERSLKKEYKNKYTKTLIDEHDLKVIMVEKTEEQTQTDQDDDQPRNSASLGAAIIASDIARGTRWCVTDVETADEYLNSGPLYFIIYDNKKMLYHLESEQLMNSIDDECFIERDLCDRLVEFVPGIDDFCVSHFQSTESAQSKYQVVRKRNKKIEAEILNNFNRTLHMMGEFAFNYAINAIGGRWPEVEQMLIESARDVTAENSSGSGGGGAIKYSKYIIRGRWPELERFILSPDNFSKMSDRSSGSPNAYILYAYALGVMPGKSGKPPGRWPDAEPFIISSPIDAARYARDVIADSDPRYELFADKTRDFGPWPEAERYIISDPYAALTYAVGGQYRWKELEEIIYTIPDLAMYYAIDVLGERWPEAEPYIMKSAQDAYYYACTFMSNTGWPEAEPYIMKDPETAKMYKRKFKK